jgi:hypothetical protein
MEEKKLGRPTDYNQELSNNICKQLALGNSLRSVCKADGMPDVSTVFDWLHKYDDFAKQYAWAKEESADAMAEEILDLSDEGRQVISSGAEKKSSAYAQIVRLQVDTRKWIMSKMKPKKYGDKMDLTTLGEKLPAPIAWGLSVNKDGKPE